MVSRAGRCPWCGAGNRPQMTWCIECGEPLEGDARPPAAEGAARPATARAARWGALRGHWEWVLGVGLLLAVLLAGGVDWWQQEHGATAYHRGAAAVAGHQWATALLAFEAAGGYHDAPARAAAARATLQTLTRLYDTALAAEGRREWGTAARAYSSVAALQPDFREVARRLPAARTALVQQQAAGAIYGSAGPTGGLDLARGRGAIPWRLPGSDSTSRVRLYTGGGRWVVYDGTIWPATGAHGDPTHRVLMLADLADLAHPRVETLPADLSPDGTATAAPAGFWWFSPTGPGTQAVYYDYAARTVRPIWLTPGWTINATDSVHGWLLLAYNDPLTFPPLRTWLYLSDATGVVFDAVTVADGQVQDAQISPDGQAVLFTTTLANPPWNQPWLRQVLVRRDVPNEGPFLSRREIVLDSLDPPPDGYVDRSRLTAHFVPGGPPTQILSDHSDYNGRRQTLINLDTGMQATIWTSLPPPLTASAFDLSAHGAWVLTQHPEATDTRLVLQPTQVLTTKREVQVPSTPDSTVSIRRTPQDDYLLITVGYPRANSARQAYTLYSVALSPEGVPGPPTRLYSGLYAPGLVAVPGALAAPGGAALLYLLPDGTLQVLTLDGTVSGPLATGVRRVWVP